MTLSAYAQDEAPPPEAADEADTIVVTGSRIARPDLVANSPVTVVDSEEVTLTGTVNAEELLNELPQVIPGLDRSANNPGNGTATVSLRGLGTQRTLVLVNSRRWIPSGLGSTVDLNTIPASLIERIDVVTGGASAVYGSDAVAGVVNFILNDDFEGVELSSNYRFTDQGDGGIFSVNATIGGNFDNGRGNATVFASYTDRDELFQGDRDFSTFALIDGAGELIPGGSSGIPGTRIFGNVAIPGIGGTGRFEPDGTLVPFISGPDHYNYAPVNYLQLPQERWNIFGSGHYQVTDWLEAYMEGTYTSSRVPQQLAPTPYFPNSAQEFSAEMTMLDTGSGFLNPFLNPGSALLLLLSQDGTGGDPLGDGIISNFIGRRLVENGERIADASLETMLLTTGVRGDLGFSDWKFDAYYQYGQVVSPTVLRGDASADRIQEGLLIEYSGAGDPTDPANWQCTSGNAACVPLNIYGAGNLTPEMVDFINLTVASVARVEQTVINGSVNGSVFTMPTATTPFQIAFGMEYRENVGDFTADTPLAVGDVAGFNDSPSVRGRFDVWEVFFEGRLPLVEDRPFVQNLTLEGGWRYSDYSTAGGVTTFKGGGEYAPIEDIRFRGLYQRAVRAPNIGELFSPQSNNFPGASDPCSTGFGSFDASAATIAACTQIFNSIGAPLGNIGTNIQPNGQIQAIIGGNPDLGAETANTWTVGAVIQPRWVPNLTMQVDYFNISITDAVGSLSAQETIDLCMVTAGGNPADEFCQRVQRSSATGQIQIIETLLANQSFLKASGIDLQVGYGFELEDWFGAGAPGSISYDFVGTWTEKSETQSSEVAPVLVCLGAFGLRCDDPTPEYKFTQRLSYRISDVTLSLRHRWLDAVSDDTVINEGACAFVVCELGAEHYLDFSAIWDVTENVQLSGGVRNLLDNDPPIIGDNQEQANTYPATYSPYGVEIFFGGRLKY